MPHQYSLAIAGILIRLESDQPIAVGDAFLPFLVPNEIPDVRVRYRQMEELSGIPDTILHEENCYRVHPDGNGGYLRSFYDAPRDYTAYATARYDGDVIRVDYLEKGKGRVARMYNSFFHLGLEELLIRKERLCFHAACVETPLGGILFSGPSGVGKSTQAELWCKHRDAKQINGDRPILSKDGEGWMAWGSPYAGSSRCHVNENCSVRAIVMLKQAKECSLRRLDSGEAFRAVWSGLTMHSWDEGFVEKVCDLALELIDAVPVFEFACTPDEHAVHYLEGELRKELCL